jgi:hypothetical protein
MYLALATYKSVPGEGGIKTGIVLGLKPQTVLSSLREKTRHAQRDKARTCPYGVDAGWSAGPGTKSDQIYRYYGNGSPAG